jgi:hypothetical protein
MLTNMLPRFPTALMATLLLVAVSACDELPTEPNGPESEVAPVGTSSSGMPKAFILPIGSNLRGTSTQGPYGPALSPATNSAVVYDAVPTPLPGSYPSLGFQATSTDEFGDLVGLTRPGVGSTVTVGMNSWACENWDTRAGTEACISSEGSSYSHDLTLNLYQVDYSGSVPAVGTQITTITQSFDIPFRPSWDDEMCTGSGETPTENEPFGGKWYAPDLSACVNGFAFTAEFDLSGLDVVLPAEVIYGIAFNTQSHGASPLGAQGPYNSLNFGVANLSAGSLGQPTAGMDIEPDALFWDTSHGPFYADGGAAGVDIFRRDTGWSTATPIISFEVTNEGFVTGGGWFTSPAGAFMPSDATVVTEADIDQPGDSDVDWVRFETNAGNGVFAAGPGTPPLGSGSFQMSSTDGSDKVTLFNYDHIGTALADIESIGYATYRSSASTNSAAQYPAINIQVDYVGDGSSFTTLVWEPIYVAGQAGLLTDTWQTWDAMAPSQTSFDGGWWSTNAIPGVCAFSCFVTWDDIVTNNPNAKIKFGFGVNIGSGWNGVFSGATDALSITTSGTTTTYDFEEAAPADPTGKASFGFVSRYKKGANTPSGNTQFTFEAGDLNFHSASYDWLVVNQGDSNAQFKGEGTINGSGSYEFMLWAGDKDPDTFRIKIWETVGGQEDVVYDNGTDQPIEGGQIVIHGDKGNK